MMHETLDRVMEVTKEIQLYIDEEVNRQIAEADRQIAEANKQIDETTKKADETRINDMKNIKAATGWTTEQTLEALKIPVDQWIKYANFL